MKTKYLTYLLDNGNKIKRCDTCVYAGNYFSNVINLGDECSQLKVAILDNAICDLYEPHYGKIKYLIKEKANANWSKSKFINAKYREVKDDK